MQSSDESIERARVGELDRRAFLRLAAVAGVGAAISRQAWADAPIAAPATAPTTAPATAPSIAPPVIPGIPTTPASIGLPRHLARFPEKTDLYLLTDRPPQLETPIKYFQQDLTPNDAFFVRWHLAGIPTEVDTNTFRLNLGGHVDRMLSLSIDELQKQFEPVSLVAVAQCSGNSRGFFQPRVTGGQWGNGAMGNAKWTGVRLRDLLAKAGVKSGAVEVTFSGLDIPPVSGPEHFVKSLSFNHANDGEVMIAYAMNDAPLPMLNGFPMRLVVPGWFATYWVKALTQINVLDQKFKNFWMEKAYRIPNNPEGTETPAQQATDTVPINKHTVRSIFVLPEVGAKVSAGTPTEIQGIALDWGAGIARVDVSIDDGKTWNAAKLDPQISKYSWRRWRYAWNPSAAGESILQCKATNAVGETQVTAQWNHSGYQRNVIERMVVKVI